ncbi:aldo/keto reductase [Streptomyces pseudoechinosporeus]
MRRATLGRSSVAVTELSFGAAALGNLYTPVDEDEALAAVDSAWDVGIRYFDTAPHYGLGLSERRLGAALRTRPRHEFTISTKVGRLLRPDGTGSPIASAGFDASAALRRVWDFTADGVRRSLDESLDRLGLDRVDMVYLHDPDDHAEVAFTEAYPALERLRAEGMVGAIGVGMNQSAMPARFLRDTDIDAVLLAGRYTLLDQDGLHEVLPEAAARGKGVVIGGVFNSGLLADPKPGAAYDYAPAPEAILTRALHLQKITRRHNVPLRAAALRFALTHPAVTTVLLGARSSYEVKDAHTLLAHPIPAAMWTDLRSEGLLPESVPVPGDGPSGSWPAAHDEAAQ